MLGNRRAQGRSSLAIGSGGRCGGGMETAAAVGCERSQRLTKETHCSVASTHSNRI